MTFNETEGFKTMHECYNYYKEQHDQGLVNITQIFGIINWKALFRQRAGYPRDGKNITRE